MKILHVIDTLNIGGAERVSIDLCNILYAKGVDVSIVTLTDNVRMRKHLNPGIPFYSLHRRWKWNPFKLFMLNAYCNNFGIVHVHLRYNFRYVALARFIFNGSYELLLHDHFGDIDNEKGVPAGLRFFLRNSWFAGVSQPLVDWANQIVGMRTDRSFLLSNIIVKKPGVKPGPKQNSDFINILNISNFRQSKNHIFAFDLIERLKESMSIKVCFVGQVIDTAYFMELKNLIKKHAIEDVVSMRHDCDDPQEIMVNYDLAIHTAHQESGPLVLMEYIAQKLPFIAFRTGEVATQIHKIIPDFFMTDFEVDNWINGIKKIITAKNDYSDKMYNCFETLYSEQAYFNACMGIYNRIGSDNE